MTDPPPGGPLTPDEIRTFELLFARYAAYDLDQFESLHIGTPHGDVFVEITRAERPGFPGPIWNTIWPRP
jgi:hypothetical protein